MSNDLGKLSSSMTKQQKDTVSRNFDASVEKHFKSHRPVPNGRNAHLWGHDYKPEDEKRYRSNFDSIFPNSPGVGI